MQSARGSLVKSDVTLDNQDKVPMNATFEMAEDDISLVSGIFNLSWSFDAIETNLSLFVTNMNEFDQEAPFMLARDSTYRIEFTNHKLWKNYSFKIIFSGWWYLSSRRNVYVEFHKSLEPSNLVPSELLVGEKALIYLHSNEFDIFNSFWY